MTYTPRQITETDEPTWSDCTGAAMLMQADAWTFGEIFLDKSGKRLSDDEIHALREVIRPGPSNDASGSNPADWDGWIDRVFPEILHIPSWDNSQARLRESWPFYLRAWQSEQCGILQGNPSHVSNASSKLRRWTNNDDFGHAVYVDRVGSANAFVRDPLAPRGYAGDWVPLTELKQYAFIDGSGWVYGSLITKGGQNSVTLNATIAALRAQLATRTQERDTAQRRVVQLNAEVAADQASLLSAASATAAALAARDAAVTTLGTLPADLKAAQDARTAANLALATANSHLVAAQSDLAARTATVATDAAIIADLQAKLSQPLPGPVAYQRVINAMRKLLGLPPLP